jgi:hypothetical protein
MSGLSISHPREFFAFPDSPSFANAMEFLEVADICRATIACKRWSQLGQSEVIWRNAFEKEGIPVVDGKKRDYKKDLKILYPITISGRRISRVFGEMLGRVPPISEKWFNKLQEEDPFEKGQFIRENYVFVVLPSLITRTVDQETPLALLNESKNLIELPKLEDWPSISAELATAGKLDLTISFSLKNLQTLCSYPLRGKENMPVFNEDFMNGVFDQCNPSPDQVRVYFMRKCIVEQSKDRSYPDQKRLVEDQGFEVTSLKVRALFDAIMILESGTCPDNKNSLQSTFARTSDTVNTNYGVGLQVIIGSFAQGVGVNVMGYDSSDDRSMGVVPSSPEETPQP